MRQVSFAKAKINFDDIIRSVEAGETVLIETESGGLVRLIAEGLIGAKSDES